MAGLESFDCRLTIFELCLSSAAQFERVRSLVFSSVDALIGLVGWRLFIDNLVENLLLNSWLNLFSFDFSNL